MKFPKKQAQRLIPEYLLDYTTKLNESHPDPTESWGGGSGGSEYTAGDGIDITNNVISVDNTIAKKSEIPTNYVTTDTEQTITNNKRITGRLSIGNPTGSEIYIDGHNSKGQVINIYNDELGSAFCTMIDNGSIQGNTGAYFTYEDNKGLREYRLPYQDREGLTTCTLATNLDIPSLDGYATQTWVQEQGYSKFSGSYNDLNDKPDLSIYAQSSNLSTVATSGSYNDLTDKPTLATVATSGSYNDLTDKPTIPDTSKFVTTDTMQEISGTKTFKTSICTEDTYEGTLEGYRLYISTSQFQYQHFNGENREDIIFKLPTSKPSGTIMATTYTLATTDDIPTIPTLATVATTGSYNDLNDKPTIPTVNNPTITFTQGGTTKGTITLNQSGDQTIEFDAGGGGGSTTNMVTTNTNQDITGEKTFVGTKRIKFKQSYSDDRLGFTGYDANGTELGYLEMTKRDRDFTGNPTSNILGYWSSLNSSPNPSADVMLGFKYFTKDSDGNTRNYRLVVPPRYNETSVTRYIPISVNGNTADNTGNINVPTETLVFTLADNSTVEVNVMTSATVSNTNTVS